MGFFVIMEGLDELAKLIEKQGQDFEKNAPIYNGLECKKGCNCAEIEMYFKRGEVKNYPCLEKQENKPKQTQKYRRDYTAVDLFRYVRFLQDNPHLKNNIHAVRAYNEKYPKLSAKQMLDNLSKFFGSESNKDLI